MGRVGVIIPVLMMCGLLVSACSSESSAAPKKTSPARVTTNTVRIGRFTQIFDTPLPADPAQASVVEGFRTAMILWDKSQENLMLVSLAETLLAERPAPEGGPVGLPATVRTGLERLVSADPSGGRRALAGIDG